MVEVSMQELNLGVLEYSFLHKPLLTVGKAMEYYDLRKARPFHIKTAALRRLSTLLPEESYDFPNTHCGGSLPGSE